MHAPMLALDELHDEVGACAPQLVALHLQVAVVERGEFVRDERRQVAARAGDRVEDRVRRGDVVDDGLRERDRAPSQRNPQNLKAVAEVVVVRDERTDAGPGFVGNARDGCNAERGGDRRGRVDERAADLKAVEPVLEQLDRGLDVHAWLRLRVERGFPSAATSTASAAVRRRRAKILIALVACGNGIHALGGSAAAEVVAHSGEVPVEPGEGCQRRSRHLWQLSCEYIARCVKLGHLCLALKKPIEGGERVERARESVTKDARALRRVTPGEARVEVAQHRRKSCDCGRELDRQNVLL